MINTHNGIKAMDLPPVNIEDYPAIKRHLNNFGKDLIRSDRGDSIYNLRNCAYMQDFFKQKIIFSEISKMPCFHLDNESFFAEATTFIMTGLNLDFLLTLLNSKPVTYIFKKFYAGGGLGDSGLRYKKAFLELLPLPNKILSHKIEHIIENEIAKNKNIEKEISKIIYQLFKFNEEEVKFIEQEYN